MLRLVKPRSELQRKAGDLYGVVVTQARQPEFYAELGIPDTPIGRYELVVLHLFLILRRLQEAPREAGELPRMLVEAFVEDMDDSLRELGTGDLAVARKVRRAAAGLYERSQAYRQAFADGGMQELTGALSSHLAAQCDARQLAALAAYARAAWASLASQDVAGLLEGKATFPPVEVAMEKSP
jgi:cytochrome b pre-mRNA-processing protein 3